MPAVLSRATSRAAIGVVLLLGVLVAPGYATTPAGAPAELSDGHVGGGQRITDTPRIRASLTVADAFFAAPRTARWASRSTARRCPTASTA